MDSPAVQVVPETFTKECLLRIDPAMLSDLRQLTFRQFWTDCQKVDNLLNGSISQETLLLATSYSMNFKVLINDIVIHSAEKAYRKLNPSHRQGDEGSKLEL